MRFINVVIWVVSSILVILVAFWAIEAIGRALILKGKTEYAIVKSNSSNSRVLFVYYQGILADPRSSSAGLRHVWHRYGDVMLVTWSGNRFISEQVVKTVTDGILDHSGSYDRVVFIGSSMGGLLSYDTAMKLIKLKPDIQLAFVLVDAPTKRSDLQSPLDKLTYVAQLTGGPLLNLFSKPYFNLTFVEPKDENIEPGAALGHLERHVRDAKSFSVSMNNDWIRYIVGHEELIDGALKGYPAVYIRSLRDHDTVREAAFYSWQGVFNSELDYLAVDSTHVGYNEAPRAWRNGFTTAFSRIGTS